MQQFFDGAQAGSRRSNCAKQKVGAVLVKDGSIISVGWNSCACGGCHRSEMIPSEKCERLHLPSGEGYELSRPVHAEVSAMLRIRLERSADDFERCIATVEPIEELVAELFTQEERALLEGATLYLSGHTYACDSCQQWATLLGIESIVFAEA
ncbi:MAG: hypothetical protein ABIG34_05430 [Candidatus Peregrinibacteria bacterium]